MKIYKVSYEKSLCRACLQLLVKKNTDSFSVKHDIFEAANLSKKFILCTSLNCEPTDGFPKYLCDSCFNMLNAFHQFKEMCIESEKRIIAITESSQMMMPFEPELDLEKSTKTEITIGEPDVLFQSDAVEIKNSNELETLTEIEITICDPDVMFQSCSLDKGAIDSNKNEMNDDTKLDKAKIKGNMKRVGRSENTKRKCNEINKIKSISEKQPANKLRRGRSRRVIESVDDNSLSENAGIPKGHQEPFELDCEYLVEEADKRKDAHFATVKTNEKKTLNDQRLNNFGSKRNQLSKLQCDVCPSKFVVEHHLIAHKRSHDGLVPYPCPRDECDKGFKRWAGLSEHVKEHEVRNQSFGCEEIGCVKVCSSQLSLALHQRTFHKQYKYICETCGKVFKTMSLLNDHSYSHKDNSELPHVCDQCNRRFTQKRSLKEHLLRHAGIKNFICPHCGVGKTSRNELKYHINYHTLERTWPCSLCTHVSNKAVNLNRHIRTVHDRIKNYACRYCGRSFANCKTLRHHEMIHTGEKPHECPECGKRFIQLIALRTHQKMHHGFRIATTMRSVPLETTDVEFEFTILEVLVEVVDPVEVKMLAYGKYTLK